MTKAIDVGVEGSRDAVVEEQHCTRRGDYLIFSTPSMVQLLEQAAIAALAPCLDESQISVGAKVDVSHLAPTLMGQRVTARAIVTAVDGAKVSFDVSIFDDVEKVGEAKHERFVLEADRYFRCLSWKLDAGTENK